MMMMIIIIITKPFKTYLNTYLEITSRNQRKQPHWALHAYFGNYVCKRVKLLAWEITCTVYKKQRITAKIYLRQTFFQLYNCNYRV